MVHHGLDYTHTWHLLREIVCFKRGGFWPVIHPNYMYDYLKQWWNQETLWIRLILAILFGTQHTWYGRGIISNNFATCAFWAILCLFYFSLPTTPPIWQMFQVLLMYFGGVSWPYAYKEGIWGYKPWYNSSFNVVAAYFWMVLLGMGIWHVSQNAMFVFWRHEEGMYEGSWPLVHPLWVWDGWLGGIFVHLAGSGT